MSGWLRRTPNALCNKGFNGNTAKCGGAKGCPADAYRNSCACKPENCAPSPLFAAAAADAAAAVAVAAAAAAVDMRRLPRRRRDAGGRDDTSSSSVFPKWLGAVDPSGTYETPFRQVLRRL